MTPAVFDQTTIDVEAKGKDGATYMFRATGSVEKFDGFLKVYEEGKDEKDEEDEELKHKLPVVAAGETLKFRVDRSGAAFHRAAAAIHRSDAGEGTRSRRRGPSVHLRVDSVDHPGTRIRPQGRREVLPDRAGDGGHRSAARKLQRSVRRDLHGAHGSGARRDRRRQNRLAHGHERVLRALPEGSGSRRHCT